MIINKEELLKKHQGINATMSEEAVMANIAWWSEQGKYESYFKQSSLSEDTIKDLEEAGYSVEEYTDEKSEPYVQMYKVGWGVTEEE